MQIKSSFAKSDWSSVYIDEAIVLLPALGLFGKIFIQKCIMKTDQNMNNFMKIVDSIIYWIYLKM